VSLYRRGGTWWIDVGHRGRRVRRSTGTGDRDGARVVHDTFRAELHRLKPGGRTFHGAIEAWRELKSLNAADGYRLDKLEKLYPDRPLHQVTAESLAVKFPSTSVGTFNRYANLATAVLSLAKKNGWIDAAPRIERKSTTPGRLRWLTREEWHELRKHLPEHQRAMATFALATGLRQANVLRLEWSQIDLRRRVAWIHADQAKNRRAIAIPLSREAMRVLAGQKGRHAQWVFPYQGRAIQEIKTGWKDATEKAGLRGFTWHGLRHTWASWHVMAGTPLEVLQKLGGWSSIQMVLHYAKLDPGYLRQWADNAKPKSVPRSVTGTR